MNNTTGVIGVIIIIILAIAVFMLVVKTPATTTVTATSTATGTTGDVTAPAGSNPSPTDVSEDTPGSAPKATTNETAAPTDTTVVVTGTVNPNGAQTEYWYEYGVGTSLGKQTTKQTIGSGRVAIVAPGYITGLTKSTTYYYRLVAENQYGKSTGEQNTVRTSAASTPTSAAVPTAKTFPANAITKTTATLRGEVNPNKGETQYWFEYGRTNRLGNTTPFMSLGNGNTSIVASAELKLNPNTTYYFRVNAQNEFGTVNGTIMTFKTAR